MRCQREKPVVGQILYGLNVGNAAIRCEQKLTPYTVTNVGGKYFTAVREGWSFKEQFHLDTWAEKTEYTASCVLYASPDEWKKEKELTALREKVRKYFSDYGRTFRLTEQQATAIIEVLEI